MWTEGRRDACSGSRESRWLSGSADSAQWMMLMTIEAAIREMDPMRTISGLIFTPWVSSLKKVRRPALDAGIGALSFLLLILRPRILMRS